MSNFFTDDNHSSVVSSCTTSPIDCVIVAWYQNLKNKFNSHALNSQWPDVIFCQALVVVVGIEVCGGDLFYVI